MKKFLIVLVTLAMILTIGTIDVQAAQNWDGLQSSTSTIITVEDLKVKINNQAVDFNSFPPYRTVNGIMVPVAEAAKAAGASVEYIKITKEAKVKLNDTTLVFLLLSIKKVQKRRRKLSSLRMQQKNSGRKNLSSLGGICSLFIRDIPDGLRMSQESLHFYA